MRRLGVAEVRDKLKRAICKFPTEWDRKTIAARYAWLRTDEEFRIERDEDWSAFLAHAESITFDTLPAEYEAAMWHVHPRQFIAHMRRCGWLSQDDVVALMRHDHLSRQQVLDRLNNPLPITPRTGGRPANLHEALQLCMRKYGISAHRHRTAYLISQIAEETGHLDSMIEKGADSYFSRYEPGTEQGAKLGNSQLGDGARFKGRGLIQITGRENYANFSTFKGADYMSDMGAAMLGLNASLSCDAGGFFWAWKQRYTLIARRLVSSGERGINYWADRGVTLADAQQVTKCINSAMLHFSEVRWPAFEHAWHALNDSASRPPNFRPIP